MRSGFEATPLSLFPPLNFFPMSLEENQLVTKHKKKIYRYFERTVIFNDYFEGVLTSKIQLQQQVLLQAVLTLNCLFKPPFTTALFLASVPRFNWIGPVFWLMHYAGCIRIFVGLPHVPTHFPWFCPASLVLFRKIIIIIIRMHSRAKSWEIAFVRVEILA